ncbi:MAG: ABC transporter ATP-binding protein [Thermodesulfobacteriota bacterium]
MTAGEMLIVEGLSKRFDGVLAVDRLSFALPRGSVCGFVGPNGAGKTTTMRIAATLEEPDAGQVLVDGMNILEEPYKVRRSIGFMPDHFGVYPDLTCQDYLEFYARAYEVNPRVRPGRISAIMEFTGLDRIAEKKVETLSKGMKQRLNLSRALVNDPVLLILDEPAAGLDPHARIEFRYMVKSLAEQGKTIFISSHILADLGEICDLILIIDNGARVSFGSFAQMQESLSPEARFTVRLVSGDGLEGLERFLLERPGVQKVAPGLNGSISFTYTGELSEIPALLSEMLGQGFAVVEFRQEAMTMESVFLKITKPNG